MTTRSEARHGGALLPLAEIASRAGIPESALIPIGRNKAKIDLEFCSGARRGAAGKLILVTAMTPTPAGEGKTTTSIALADGLRRIGERVLLCLREPSLGPVFGAKGGATGGGRARVAPSEEINLHFTGDFHAITSAHNLLAAAIDNHLHQGNALGLKPETISWGRVLDMNDRALRQVTIGQGGKANGPVRESRFDITPASEVMAIFCLSRDLADLRERLGRIVIGEDGSGRPVRAAELRADGAMTALLRDALAPNLVQTLEGTPALVHGGPFANIAHGCNSVLATSTALGLGGWVVTEAGFGSDLGAEKFVNIKCRQAGLKPVAAVVVATLRAMRMHGGAALAEAAQSNPKALEAGFANLRRHVENVRGFGLPVVVSINRHGADPDQDLQLVRDWCAKLAVRAEVCDGWANGGEGSRDIARAVVETARGGGSALKHTYDNAVPLKNKIESVARSIYRGDGVDLEPKAEAALERLESLGLGNLPICIAKTPYSFSADPKLIGAPTGFRLPVRDVRLSAGAGFVVVLAGDVMTMPGLPKVPAAERIGVDADGTIVGVE
jgi:formate--tetrahydrofolate ligase